jgi:hypothetical protein
VRFSKSRYVYLNNRANDVIRVSDHSSPGFNPTLNIIIRSPGQLKAGLQRGLNWLEGHHGAEAQATATR